jgi:NAD(P)-dependent dehydrogenase (short-subunit alcohol dehydrogenase family)
VSYFAASTMTDTPVLATLGARFDLAGATALVTGASSGLGWHFALTLAAAGARVAVAARRITELEELAAAIIASGGAAVPIVLDVLDSQSVATAIAATEAGLGPLDILVNNAGIAATTNFLTQDEAEWRGVLATNLDGAWRVAQAVASRMAVHGRGGAIVNIASIVGLRPASHLAAYSAAKAGLISLTRSMAIELARYKIRVNALAPGYVETDLNRDFLRGPSGQAMAKRVPLRRFGAAEDLDGALLLLVSDAGRYMTGSVVVVDGGHSAGIT